MFVAGCILVVLAVLTLIWSLVRLFRRDPVKLPLLIFLVLAILGVAGLWIGEPHYKVQDVAVVKTGLLDVTATAPSSEQSHFEQDAADIVAQVRKEHPDAAAIRVQLFLTSTDPKSGAPALVAVWGPSGDWNQILQGKASNVAPQIYDTYTVSH